MLLTKVEKEMYNLEVRDEELAQIISMGYKSGEARIALRATKGNVEAAVNHILQQREDKNRLKNKESEERSKIRKKKLSEVNKNLHNQLVAMGFNDELAQAALRSSSNDILNAITKMTKESDSSSKSKKRKYTDEQLSQVPIIMY